MIEKRCLGADVDPSRIHPEAEIGGCTYLTGRATFVGRGAVVRDTRGQDAFVAAGAEVFDSLLLAEPPAHSHRCDAAGRLVVRGWEFPEVGEGARVSGCTLINTRVGEQAEVSDTWSRDVRVGPGNRIDKAKVVLTNTGYGASILGPTEVSEAWLGDFTTIDRMGYYEGVFSNTFRKLRFNPATRRLEVSGTIHLPHLSRYGTNTVNSTNSGKLLPQADGILRDFGPHQGLWCDPLLSHEQIELGPCCWVAPWTKIVGQSPEPHPDDASLVNDRLMTYVMPFALAGYGGTASNGLVMPGELSNGYGPKRRHGAWVFTYSPDLVFRMVRRLYERMGASKAETVDGLVPGALRTALEISKAMAAWHDVDLVVSVERQPRGWPRWIAGTHALLAAHLASGLWEFRNGEPAKWEQKEGRWTHPAMETILALAPDAMDRQVSEEQVFGEAEHGSWSRRITSCGGISANRAHACVGAPPLDGLRPAMPAGRETPSDPRIDATARVAADAWIGPGCEIRGTSEIGSGARVWHSVLENVRVGPAAIVDRSLVQNGSIGAHAVLRSCRMTEADLGERSVAEVAEVSQARLAASTTVSAFASVHNVKSSRPAILGSAFEGAEIDTLLMSMHIAGSCRHVVARPTNIVIDGRPVAVAAVPMIGGGAVILGTAEKPVEIEGSFIGSNSIIEPGTHIGFGCFVQGRLGPDAGLLPFTLADGPEPATHDIGGVLSRLPSVILTHLIGWAFQALGAEGAPAVAEVVRQSIQRGIDAVEREQSRRAGGPGDQSDAPEQCRCLAYSDAQLEAGRATYVAALAGGAWEILYDGERLVFSSPKGRWTERRGSACWEVKK